MFAQKLIFSAVPGQSNPQTLLLSFQKQLLKSLKVYFVKFGETIRKDLSYIVDRVDQINPQRRLSPSLYGIYAQMKSSYEAKNLESLFHIVQRFKNHTEESCYADTVTFSTFLSETWEESIVFDLKSSIPSNSEEKNLYPLIHWNEKDYPPSAFQIALTTLNSLDEELYQEYSVYVSSIKFFASKFLISCTSNKFFGAIYLRPPLQKEDALLHYLDGLAHEVSHLHLYAMMGEDPIVLNDPKTLFSSPLRPDPRPMFGIFHSAFVLSRMIRILRLFKQKEAQEEKLLKRKEEQFHEACTVIAEKAQMTQRGQELFNSLESCAFQDQ